LTVKASSSEVDLKAFYELNCKTRKKFGVPPKPYRFFKNLWDILNPKNMVDILTVYFESKPICSILYLKYKKRAHGEYMGTDETYRQFSPNIFLFWKTIQRLKAENFHSFDFGSTSANNENLLTFKRRWGTVEEDLKHYYFPEVHGVSADFENGTKYKLFTSMCRRMPDGLFRMTGNFLYNHLGG
ncbi:MAG: GNAT family N-acetyltransferase, partial [bacterium]